MPQKVMSFSRNREGKQLYQNGCVAPAQTEAPREALKDMEITEAIQDLDSKLSDIEAALHLDGHNLRKI